jgi:hypothetical protein
MPGSRDHCAQGCAPVAHQNTLRIQGESFVIIQPVSYREMPGSRDHCAQGCAPAARQNTLHIQGEFFVIIQLVSYWEMPGSCDHCAQGGAAATHPNTRIQGEFFCYNKSHLLLGNAWVM